jgi:hypothetical protein
MHEAPDHDPLRPTPAASEDQTTQLISCVPSLHILHKCRIISPYIPAQDKNRPDIKQINKNLKSGAALWRPLTACFHYTAGRSRANIHVRIIQKNTSIYMLLH